MVNGQWSVVSGCLVLVPCRDKSIQSSLKSLRFASPGRALRTSPLSSQDASDCPPSPSKRPHIYQVSPFNPHRTPIGSILTTALLSPLAPSPSSFPSRVLRVRKWSSSWCQRPVVAGYPVGPGGQEKPQLPSFKALQSQPPTIISLPGKPDLSFRSMRSSSQAFWSLLSARTLPTAHPANSPECVAQMPTPHTHAHDLCTADNPSWSCLHRQLLHSLHHLDHPTLTALRSSRFCYSYHSGGPPTLEPASLNADSRTLTAHNLIRFRGHNHHHPPPKLHLDADKLDTTVRE